MCGFSTGTTHAGDLPLPEQDRVRDLHAACLDSYMKMALEEAHRAFLEDEVPVGAVLVGADGKVMATDHNRIIELNDPTAHAEILAMRQAAAVVNNYRLPGTTLYVTNEPCVMCMAAAIHARISRIVFGAEDPKWGGAGSLYRLQDDSRFNHRPEIIQGICENACRQIMVDFFKSKRHKGLSLDNQ
jgi:tRNA(adenine34) deaminase